MRPKIEREEDRLRNTLSIRFNDAEFNMVVDAAWKNRISSSRMIRELILAEIKKQGGLN